MVVLLFSPLLYGRAVNHPPSSFNDQKNASETMTAYPENFQIQHHGRVALEKITGECFTLPNALEGASESVRYPAILRQWQA